MKPIVEAKFTVYDNEIIKEYLIDSFGKLFLLVFLFAIVIGIFSFNESYNWAIGIGLILIVILVLSYLGITEYNLDVKRGVKYQGEVKITKKIIELDSDSPDRSYLEICDSNICRIDLRRREINSKTFQMLEEGDILEIEYLPISKHILRFRKNGTRTIDLAFFYR